jgi:primosomal protein N' (replication factor Y)
MHTATANCQAAEFLPGDRLAVLLPLPLAGVYDYLVGNGQRLAAGDFVRVQLGRGQAIGVVWSAGGTIEADKCRPVIERLDQVPLPLPSRRFIDWVAAYTLAAPGAVLRMAMSVRSAIDPKPRQRRAAPCPLPDWRRPGLALSADQAVAAAALRRAVGGGFTVTLLEGVTGSGKTEVYFEAVAEVLARGRQVLVLLPEISLSAQWLARFAARFGAPPREWHSDLTDKARRDTWRAVAEGAAKVVVGARSALFLPFRDLGLIVVDEEHDASFKQEDGVIYHARDMAVVRARLGAIPIALVSATPSLETRTNVEAGRYRRLHLPTRHGGAKLPSLQLIDMRRHGTARQSWLSQPLIDALTDALAAGEQAMLFLNRRGYAPLTLCRACGHRLKCPHCTAWLVSHRSGPLGGGSATERLRCHHCGYSSPLPAACPECRAADSFAACGPGVERLAEEVAARFPDARTAVMTSDTISGPRAAADLVDRMVRHEIDLLIGTQIVAKGHHFPLLTVVGVVDADLGLAGGDLRAAERTYQLLWQVAGRAGRAAHAGHALLQTYQPEDKVMEALVSGDADRFFAAETEDRRAAGMPPFGRLAALIVSGPEATAVDRLAAELARRAPRGADIEVFGPVAAPLAVLRGRHRRRFLLKTARTVPVQSVLRRWLDQIRPPSSLRLQVDIDPYSFL